MPTLGKRLCGSIRTDWLGKRLREAKDLDRFLAVYNAHDLKEVLAYFTENASYHSHVG